MVFNAHFSFHSTEPVNSGGVCSGDRAATLPAVSLGQNRNQVLPAEGAKATLLHIPVAGAAVVLRAGSPSIDMLAAQGRVESGERLTDFAINFPVNHSATGGGTHLTLRFFNEQRLAHSHKSRAGSAGDTGNVGSDEGAVGSGGDNGGVHKAEG